LKGFASNIREYQLEHITSALCYSRDDTTFRLMMLLKKPKVLLYL